MSLFGATSQLVEVKIYYKNIEISGGSSKIVVLSDKEGNIQLQQQEEFIKKKQEKQEEIKAGDRSIEVLTTMWKILSWGDQNKITKRCERYTPEGLQSIDYYKFRDLRIKSCLQSWDAKDAKGTVVPVTTETIDMLPSDVVFALVNRYDTVTEGSQDEQEKN
jgi:hypothetical protein